jgi:hypothetical protein
MTKTQVARWPTNTERITVVGKTGSGKTQMSAWHLSTRNWDEIPWIIIDFKGDPLLTKIPAKEISVNDEVPDEPGLYRMMPDSRLDAEALEGMFDRIHKRGNVGLYIDEGYQISPYSPGLARILTQGRSRHIPTMFVSQRPAWVSKFVYTETEYLVAFHLNALSDRKRVEEFLPEGRKVDRLPPFHSYHYDIGRDNLTVLRPVESEAAILARFQERYNAMHAEDTIQETAPNLRRFRVV